MDIEEIEKLNKKNFEESKKQFNEFRSAIHNGKCSLCDKSLNYFNESEPCLHWLLKPSGFKKKHLPLINSIFGHERIQSFLRWYVNSFDLFVGINDLDEEHAPGKIMAVTIKHGDLEWSFNISPEDFAGHRGWPPHYHLQIKVDGKRYITFGEYHLPLSDYDQWCIKARLGKIPEVNFQEIFGAGVGTVLKRDDINPEELLQSMRSADDENKAAFSISTMIEADPGTTISGDDIAKLIEEHKKTGLSMSYLSSKLKNVKTQVIIEAGDGVPAASDRTTRKKRKN